MESKIDWSNAPEGATHYVVGSINPFEKRVGDDWFYYVGGAWARIYRKGDDRITSSALAVVPRPTTPSWSGEGLPPVGVVCMANGYQVVIVAHHCNGIHAIYAESEYDGLLYYGEPNEFRHIRTPEQIAGDARSKAIDEMVKALGMDDPGTAEYIRCGLIYDAGFRKQ